MRLIDADKLMLSLADWKLQESPISTYPKPKEFTADDMQRMIWRTIRDCESAVEEQPTLKAIPIEWIKNKKVDFQNEEHPFNYCRGFQDGYNDCIDYLVSEWEEENEVSQR